MGITEKVLVEPLRGEFLRDVIRIHRVGLGYSTNSKLGADHLAYLYETMAGDPECYVGVAVVDEKPVGVISGTADADRLRSRMFRAMPVSRVVGIAGRLLYQPWLIAQWIREAIIAAPVVYEGQEVRAVLTAIATDREFQGRGVGKRLVQELEMFLGGRQIACYRLDTLSTNTGARAFYAALGFVDVGKRADSQVFVKTLTA